MAIVGYEYQKRLNGTSEWDAVEDLGAQLDLSEVVAELPSATTWDFRIRGYDVEGNRTSWSNIATASTFGLTVTAAHMCCTGACGLNVHAQAILDCTIDTVIIRPGGTHSIRLEAEGDGNASEWLPYNLNVDGHLTDGFAVRFYIRFESLPDSDALICWSANDPFFGPTRYGLAFHSASGTFRLATMAGGIISFVASGSGVLATNAWILCDIRWFVDGSEIHCEASIDEDEILELIDAPSDLDLTQPRISTDDTATIFRVADFILSTAKDDYPIGPGHIRRWLPAADGNHRIDSTGDFKVGSTGTDIADSDTTSHQLIDDPTMPTNGGTLAGDDYIRQAAAAGGSGTQYVEHGFANPDGYIPTSGPRLVQYLNARHADGGGAAVGQCRIIDNETSEQKSDFSEVGGTYKTGYEALPVSLSLETAWKITGDDGNFLAIKHQFGFSNGSGDPCLDAVMIEAEFAGEEE